MKKVLDAQEINLVTSRVTECVLVGRSSLPKLKFQFLNEQKSVLWGCFFLWLFSLSQNKVIVTQCLLVLFCFILGFKSEAGY